jgi:hypothetical protein
MKNVMIQFFYFYDFLGFFLMKIINKMMKMKMILWVFQSLACLIVVAVLLLLLHLRVVVVLLQLLRQRKRRRFRGIFVCSCP